MGTGFSADGDAVHQTPVAGYPLPPPLPGRVLPEFNGNGQYRLPDPVTGLTTSYTRASTVAKTLEDTYMLGMWEQRMMLLGVWKTLGTLYGDLDQLIAGHIRDNGDGGNLAAELRGPLNKLAEESRVQAGSKHAAEFGTATHAWCEWVDLGYGTVWDVPEMFRPWVVAHRRTLAKAGLRVDPYWTERIVLNTRYGIAGTLDRLVWTHDDRLHLGDIKTSKGLDYSWLYFAIQLAIYHGADYVLSLDGTTWEPMPRLEPSTALVIHLPRESPDTASVVPISMDFGADALRTAMTVRKQRTVAERAARSVPYDDRVPTETALWYAARCDVEMARTADELSAIWEQYQAVWTDDLTELGRKILRSATERIRS